MQFCVARKKKILSRPQSSTPRVYRQVRPSHSPQPENFRSYFFGEDKECQTFSRPSKCNGISICQKFLRSHRGSIEREVVSIFQNDSRTKVFEETVELKENGQKTEGFKKLLKQARGVMKPLRQAEDRPSISVRKLSINKKVRTVSCNKYFGTPKISKIYFQAMGPGLRSERYNNQFKKSVKKIMDSTKLLENGHHSAIIDSIALEGWNTIK